MRCGPVLLAALVLTAPARGQGIPHRPEAGDFAKAVAPPDTRKRVRPGLYFWIFTVDRLEDLKPLEAYIAHRIKRIAADRIDAQELPDGQPLRPVELNAKVRVLEVRGPGWHNDGDAARVYVLQGRQAGRVVWMRLSTLRKLAGRDARAAERLAALLPAVDAEGVPAGPSDEAGG